MQELHIPAAQLAVIQHGRIVKLGAYGIANVEHDVSATSESIFSINSCTKAFIGVAVMQLAEAGKLKVDDPVSMYLHDLPASWQKVTIRQALSHTSGLPNISTSMSALWAAAGPRKRGRRSGICRLNFQPANAIATIRPAMS